MLDQIEAHYRGLEALKVDMKTYSNFCVPFLLEKVPEQMRIKMIRFSNNDHLEWNIKDFIEALENEVVVRESHVPLGKQNNHGNSSGKNMQQRKRSSMDLGTAKALMSVSKKRSKCVYCLSEHHSAEYCNAVTNVVERKAILRKHVKCFICLNPGQRTADCRQRNTFCKKCEGTHRISICNASADAAPPFPAAQTIGESKPFPAAQATGTSLNPNVALWVGNASSAPYSSNKVALQTAIAVVNGRGERKVRVLFDCGSQRSFITAKAVSDLGLVPARMESLGVRVCI